MSFQPQSSDQLPNPHLLRRRRFLKIGGAATAAGIFGLPTRVLRAAENENIPPLRILYFTDVHSMLDRGAPEKMSLTAARMAAETADIIIGGGDFVHGGFRSSAKKMEPRFAACRKFLSEIGKPVRAVLGNHDLVGVRPDDGSKPELHPRNYFLEMTGLDRSWYSFDAGGYRFFVLDSVEPVEGPDFYRGCIDSIQLEWIQGELSKTPKNMPVVICSHIPLRTTFIQVLETPTTPLPAKLVVTNANEVLELFRGHRLIAVLQGHLHVDEQIRWNGLDFIMGGAVCGSWWKGGNLGTAPGFGVIELGRPQATWRYENTNV